MKRRLPCLALCLAALFLAACGGGDAEFTRPLEPETTAAPVDTSLSLNLADYTIVRPDIAGNGTIKVGATLKKALDAATGTSVTLTTDWEKPGHAVDHSAEPEILVGSTNRPESAQVLAGVDDTCYVIACVGQKIVINASNETALGYALDYFLDEYLIHAQKGVIKMQDGFRYQSEPLATVITSSIGRLRDPCILVEDGRLYAYGTGWVGFRNDSGKLDGSWTSLGVVAEKPAESDGDYWAPEVHKYKGAYYMFTTYHSTKTGHRGCTVLRAEKPEGPFVEISGGHVTPHDWDAIDGTLYVDPDGQPWMIFVHEWTSTSDKVGRMAAAKLSDDLTHFVTEPVELFRADDPAWAKNGVTDGCYLYRCADGQLLMIWSNWDSYGYCVGVARSRDGRVDGKWEQDETLLYSKSMTGQYDGGHGMLFTLDDQLWMSLHSPNDGNAGRVETPIFIPLREENGSLVWDGVIVK